MLKEKVALITGGAQGIGQAIAIKFAEEGARIAIVDIKNAKRTISTIEKLGGEVIAFESDVVDESAMNQIVKEITEKWGKIDILVNNAGIYPLERFIAIPIELVRRIFDVNVIGTYLCSQLVSNLLIEKESPGVIINIASAAGVAPDKYHGHYSASKAAVISATKAMAMELMEHKIRVNAIAPGAIATKGVKNPGLFQKSGEIPADFLQMQSSKSSPLVKGGMGQPNDIAEMALFLASDKANYITGWTFAVDGGRLLL